MVVVFVKELARAAALATTMTLARSILVLSRMRPNAFSLQSTAMITMLAQRIHAQTLFALTYRLSAQQEATLATPAPMDSVRLLPIRVTITIRAQSTLAIQLKVARTCRTVMMEMIALLIHAKLVLVVSMLPSTVILGSFAKTMFVCRAWDALILARPVLPTILTASLGSVMKRQNLAAP